METDRLLLIAFIFVGGVTYVTLDTLRILLAARGYRSVAAVLGVAEVVVFLLAIAKVLAGPLDWAKIIAYATGFGLGTIVAVWIEARMAIGLVAMRVITRRDASELLEALRERQFGATTVAAQGVHQKVRIIFSVIQRKQVEAFVQTVQAMHPQAFISTEDVRLAREGFIPPQPRGGLFRGRIGRFWRPPLGPA